MFKKILVEYIGFMPLYKILKGRQDVSSYGNDWRDTLYRVIHHGKGFVKCFRKVPLACLGSMAATVQPNGLGNSQKTFYITFHMT